MLSNVALGSVHDALVMPDTEEMKSTMATYLRPDGPQCPLRWAVGSGWSVRRASPCWCWRTGPPLLVLLLRTVQLWWPLCMMTVAMLDTAWLGSMDLVLGEIDR